MNPLRFSSRPPPTSTEVKRVSQNSVPGTEFFLFRSKNVTGFVTTNEWVVSCSLRSTDVALTGTLLIQA